MTSDNETIKWKPSVRIDKYSREQTEQAIALLGHDPDLSELQLLFPNGPDDGSIEVHGNLLVTVGLNLIGFLIIGGGLALPFSHANAIVGVGASSTAAAVGDTALGSDNSANAWYQQCDTSNPTQSSGVITCVATFAAGNANFAWNEWCFAVGGGTTITSGIRLSLVTSPGSPIMLNHKIQSLGTKAGAAWAFTGTVTFS